MLKTPEYMLGKYLGLMSPKALKLLHKKQGESFF